MRLEFISKSIEKSMMADRSGRRRVQKDKTMGARPGKKGPLSLKEVIGDFFRGLRIREIVPMGSSTALSKFLPRILQTLGAYRVHSKVAWQGSKTPITKRRSKD